jgi:transcriptional regulator with XRE-family HTH domain
MARLRALREDIGHPERPGEPYPQDQAAARVGVRERTWQRWEGGQSVPYARHLAKIADEFGLALSDFDDGMGRRKSNGTPTPFAARDAGADRLEAIERQLAEIQGTLRRLADAAAARGAQAALENWQPGDPDRRSGHERRSTPPSPAVAG